ncbi:MAG TPA: hypothetical protein VNN76_04665 [Bacteroidota bacterium]|nr:hypothetical protein [Bacteroidota bacterium]
MKPAKPNTMKKSSKKFLKTLLRNEKRYLVAQRNAQRIRIVQSVHAGHVRGGHSFH